MKNKNLSAIIVCLLSAVCILLTIALPIRIAGFDSKKTLIVYFSRVGNTDFSDDVDAVSSASLRRKDGVLYGNCEILAEKLSNLSGADVFSVTVSENYPESYEDTVNRASHEQSDNTRPKLTSHIDNMDSYDNIIVVYPVWWNTMPIPMFSFFEEYDFSGKNIYPVATHKGSFLGDSVNDIKELCSESEVRKGIPISGGSVDFVGIMPFVMVAGWVMLAIGTLLNNRFKSKTAKVLLTDMIPILGIIMNVLCIVRILI